MELVGFGALLSILLEILKRFGVLPDGASGKVALIGSAVVVALGAFFNALSWDVRQYDTLAQAFATLLAMVLTMFGSAFFTHKGLRAAQIVGPRSMG